MRLKSGLWVAAYVRRCNVEGVFAAVRRRGGIVIVVAHRKSALAGLDQVLALRDGRVTAFGQIELVEVRPPSTRHASA